MTLASPEGYLQEIIRLQLKKPKNWNWQLSTSKSSPHISLPIIQLYDAKGQLLLETKDAGGTTQRQSWHSSDSNKSKEVANNNNVKRDTLSRHLQRCRSDTLDRNAKNRLANNPESMARGREQARSSGNKLNKSSSAVLDNSIGRRRGADGIGGSAKSTRIEQQQPHNLKKSRSDVLQENSTVADSLQRNSLFGSSREIRKHRRTKSDDVFRRTLKFSSQESLKRAEEDGYKNFLKSAQEKLNEPVNKQPNYADELGNTHNRYKTRTSSAGTLIITDETFNMHHRRRRRRRPSVGADDAPPPNPRDASNSRPIAQDDAGDSRRTENWKRTSLHGLRAGDPGNCGRSGPMLDRCDPRRRSDMPQSRKNRLEKRDGPSTSAPNGLFYSHSDVFPFERILGRGECDYVVQEPTTPSGDPPPDYYCEKSRRESGPIIIDAETDEKKARRKSRRRHSDASTSSSTVDKKYQRKRRGNGTKAHVSKDHHHLHHHTKKELVDGDSDLLQLVRRLSTDHVKMGANVSRHSSKGLSGRRSQSSGSICNGKGRHGDGKMCGSLPSYLDDRNSTGGGDGSGGGCNNNHDCEKPPLDEVQRIPPLGDGAPLHWKFSDNQTVLCDQGYGSERSPEEEYPPPLPDHDSQCHHHLEPHACYPFITPESTFTVKLAKSSRGLGLSVTGGVDCGGSWPGLIRIKRLFPHQPASACGLLNVGDLIIEANGITLTGLTNYEALEVLRTAPNQVELKVCRPPPDVLSCVSPISEVPPPPPRREPPTSLNLPPAVYSTPEDDYYHGEFEIKLTKMQGSLGFTLRKEDDSALGHYVRALVREPALTDGRIRAGDKIIAVNEVEISPMSHEQAVQFLRQCGDSVKLRLYRDSAQTPVAALSPTETTPRTSFSKKTNLRQEAVDMLNDIAVRKLIPGTSNHDTYRRSTSPTSSPRRLRRQTCPSDASQATASTDHSLTYILSEEQFHEGLLQQAGGSLLSYEDDDPLALFTMDSDEGDRPSRPISLDLYNPNQTPVAARKPRFNFSLAHNAYELNNLDPDVLDAPNLTYNMGNGDDVQSTEVECGDSFPQEPASMPHMPMENSAAFSYKNPTYQSAHPPCGGGGTTADLEHRMHQHPSSSAHHSTRSSDPNCNNNNMKKWKGVVFEGGEEASTSTTNRSRAVERTRSSRGDIIGDVYEILSIELNRGWNSRLGFSLQGAAGVTYISAVYADSVAARDGRLRPGDRIIKVNDESVEHMKTNEIIDLLRIVRGPVCIVVSRLKSKEDCPKSNAEN